MLVYQRVWFFSSFFGPLLRWVLHRFQEALGIVGWWRPSAAWPSSQTTSEMRFSRPKRFRHNGCNMLQWRLGYNSYQLHVCHGQMTFLKWAINGYYTYQNESQWCHGHAVHALTMAYMTITLDLICQQYVQLFPFFIFWMFFSSFENIVWPGEHWNILKPYAPWINRENPWVEEICSPKEYNLSTII